MAHYLAYSDALDKIENENKKSANILIEYERIVKKVNDNVKNEINEYNQQIKLLRSESDTLNNSRNSYLNNSDDSDISDDSDDENYDEIINLKKQINRLKSKSVYPHGNGIFGFALVLQEAAKNINEEWKHYIWIYTIYGYKKVYPKYATNYIEYKKDTETSDKYMTKIINELCSEKRDVNEIFYDDWIIIINSYIEKNSIILDEDIVFRPPLHSILIEDKEDINYYRIKKEDLEFTQTEEEAEEEYQDWLSMLNIKN